MSLSWLESYSKEELCGLLASLADKICTAAAEIEPKSAPSNKEELGLALDTVLEAARAHKSAKAEQRRLTWFLDSIVEHAPSMFFVKNGKDLTVELWNKKAEEISTIPRENLIGMTGFESFPREQMEGFLARDRKVLSEKVMVATEEVITTKNGDRWLYTKKIPLLDENGEAVYLVGISEDITEQKKAQEELLRAKEEADRSRWFLSSIVDNLPIMLFVKDEADLRMLLWNQAGTQLLGFEKEQMIGKTDFDLFPKEQAAFFQAKDREVLSGKKLVAVEEPITTKNGDRWLYTKKIPLLDENSEPKYLLGISEDITERREAQQALLRAKEAAEAANRAKSDFFANVSHELRTPLTLIMGPLDSLLAGEAGALTPDAKERLERMRRNANRLSSLVNDLLDFAKLEAGKMQAHWQPVPVVETVHDIVEDAQLTARARGILLSYHPDKSIGHAPLDRRMFEKIVLNLVGNALKFTPAGGEVLVSLQEIDGQLEVSVKDTGIGISPEKLPLLFQRFQQVDSSATRKYEGTGLGLALVKELATLLGGTTGVESTVQQGSRFWVRLPLNPDRLATLSQEAPPEDVRTSGEAAFKHLLPAQAPSMPSAEEAGEKPRLLLAEDNPDMRAYVVELLSEEYLIEAVENGKQALAAAARVAPDIIVSDVMMPEMNGFELVKAIKETEGLRQIPIILLTARAGQEAVATGLESGADDYLSKPFSPAELRARVRAALRLYRAYQELTLRLDELTETRELLLEAEKLTAVGQLAELVAKELSPSLQAARQALHEHAVQRALTALSRIAALVGGLEQIARAPETSTPEQFQVSEVVKAALSSVNDPALISQIKEEVSAFMPREDLRIAVSNVLSFLGNAKRSGMRKGDAPIAVEVHALQARPCISISDPMLDLSGQDLLSPRLQEADGGASVDVGLTLARHLLRRNDGALEVAPREEGGLTFRLRL